MAYHYALRALRDGHDAAKILKCYEWALQECHALATDRTATRGQVRRFELSSTVRRAKRFLANDGLPEYAAPCSCEGRRCHLKISGRATLFAHICGQRLFST
jgi:hypothetical protein